MSSLITAACRLLVLFLVLASGISRAGEFIVTTATDNEFGGLRHAISLAKAASGPDTIVFDPSLSGRVIRIKFNELVIDHPLTIDASSLPGGIIIDGSSNGDFVKDTGETRCFLISDGDDANDLAVTLIGLTIQNGLFRGTNAGANIHNRENLTLNNCHILGGRAYYEFYYSAVYDDADGGGIYSENGDLTMNSCTVSGNSTYNSRSEGGGIYVENGNLTMTSCTVSGNSTTGSDSDGGGIFIGNGKLTMDACTVSGNSTSGSGSDGGGIFNSPGTNGTISRIEHCTIVDNRTEMGTGGGYLNFNGHSQFIHCTVMGNFAPSGSGGGIVGTETGAQTELAATIVRDNSGGDVRFAANATGSFISNGSNLVATGNATSAFTESGDLVTTAPLLLAHFGNYGGSTETMPPLPGSPVIDAAANSTSTTDQRGLPVTGSAPDTGAAEAQAFVTVTTDSDENDSTGDLSLREAIIEAGAIDSPGTFVTFSPSLSGTTINLRNGSNTLGELVINKALTIDSTLLASAITIDGGSNGDFVKDPGETRCLFISDGDDDNDIPVSLNGLIIRNGVFGTADAGSNIHNRENLSLNKCHILGGRAFSDDADGGGIYSENGSLTMDSCTVSGNSTSGSGSDGGGIFSRANRISMDSCTISDNSTTGSASDGGGIYIVLGSFTMDSCTISGNSTSGRNAEGGGIYSRDSSPGQTSRLVRCTIAGNHCGLAPGGGFYNSFAINHFIHCTVSGNSAPFASGIASYGTPPTSTQLAATIVRDNTIGDVQFVSTSTNTFRSAGFNLVGTGNAVSAFLQGNGDRVTTAPVLLAPLGNYGDRTQTMPLLPGSFAIDRAFLSRSSIDQRGLPINGIPDIGAVEYQGTSDIILFWNRDFDGDGNAYGIEQALGTNNATPDPGNSRNPILTGDASGNPMLTFGRAAAALSGTVWCITRSPDLSTGSFAEIFRYDGAGTTPASPDTNVDFNVSVDSISVTDLAPLPGKAFYRFEAIPPQ